MAVSLGMVIALIKKYAQDIDPESVESAVSDWLDDHPEATTTVEDGSITEEKLASALALKLNNARVIHVTWKPWGVSATGGYITLNNKRLSTAVPDEVLYAEISGTTTYMVVA